MTKVNTYLTDQQVALLKEIAATTGLTFAEVLRRMLDQALEVYVQRQK